MSDVAEESSDVTAITALGQLTERYNDARAMSLIGKVALARGFAREQYAFPDIGLPSYSAIVPSSIAASCIRLRGRKAASTSATCHRPRQLG